MVQAAHKKLQMNPRQWRRRDVEKRLAVRSLSRRRGGSQAPGAENNHSGQVIDIRASLEQLGTTFAAFGLYLASRPDVLPLPDCAELFRIADHTAAFPINRVRELLAAELSISGLEAFEELDVEPFELRSFFQSHYATLRTGDRVAIRIRRPGTLERAERELDLLPLLEPTLHVDLKAVIRDFRNKLEQELDLSHALRYLEMLAQDSQEFEMLAPVRVYPDLCSKAVLTMERIGDGFKGADSFQSDETASRLNFIWLRQALIGRVFPVEPRPGNVEFLPDHQIAFTGGVFVALSQSAKDNLWRYLLAADSDDPYRACACLVEEMEHGPKGRRDQELFCRMRQIAPLRDGGGAGTLAEHLLLYWRAGCEQEYVAKPHFQDFCRGLATLALGTAAAQPQRDRLHDSFQSLRSTLVFDQLQSLLAAYPLGQRVESHLAAMLALPDRLDRALGRGLPKAGSSYEGGLVRQNRRAAFTGLLLLLVAVAVAGESLMTIGGQRVTLLAGVTFGVVGALLLLSVDRA
jgi:hypothetical protein